MKVFNTTREWVIRSKPEFFLRDEKMHTRSCTYLGVAFIGPWFSLRETACAQDSRGYAALGTLERQCAHIRFQKKRIELRLFDTIVALNLLYKVETWRPSLNKEINWMF